MDPRRRSRLLAAVCGCALAACGQSDTGPTDAELELWSSPPTDRARVPVLLYESGVGREQLARQLSLLDHAGYETIGLDQFLAFRRGRESGLPPHPLLLTFDGGRDDTRATSDEVLDQHDFRAVLFVDTGRVEASDPRYLDWSELDELQRSGRWDLQLQSGDYNRLIKYGPGAKDVGPFYAYRGADERIDGWRERVFSEITEGEKRLAQHVRGHRPLAFAPPHGNYGQLGTNDPLIPQLLLARLLLDYKLVFTRGGELAAPGAPPSEPVERLVITPGVDASELHRLLSAATR